MNIKDKIQAKIEKNAVKSELTWKDRFGHEHTDSIYLKRSQMPLVGDWGRVYPPINEDGSTNYMNLIFGGKQNFFKLLMIMVVLGLLFYQFTSLLGVSKEFMNGNKYVIMERELYDVYCSATKPLGDYEQLNENITIMRLDPINQND